MKPPLPHPPSPPYRASGIYQNKRHMLGSGTLLFVKPPPWLWFSPACILTRHYPAPACTPSCLLPLPCLFHCMPPAIPMVQKEKKSLSCSLFMHCTSGICTPCCLLCWALLCTRGFLHHWILDFAWALFVCTGSVRIRAHTVTHAHGARGFARTLTHPRHARYFACPLYTGPLFHPRATFLHASPLHASPQHLGPHLHAHLLSTLCLTCLGWDPLRTTHSHLLLL